MINMSKGGSARIKDIASRRILDDASRQRRARKALERLESDNNQDDPHADLVMSKKALSLFQDEGGDNNVQERRTKRKAKTLEYYKQRFRKNFSQLLEEEMSAVMTDGDEEDEAGGPVPGYLAAQVQTSIIHIPTTNDPVPRCPSLGCRLGSCARCAGSRARTPASPAAPATAASSAWRCTRRPGASSGQCEVIALILEQAQIMISYCNVTLNMCHES